MTVNDWHPRIRRVPVVPLGFLPDPPRDQLTKAPLADEDEVERRVQERRQRVVDGLCSEWGADTVLRLVHAWRRRNQP